MTNDLSTLNGSLVEMKDQLIYELGEKGVTASYDSTTGLLGLIGKISEIQQGGSCYHIELSEHSVTTTGTFTISATLQENYQPKSGATVSFTGGTSTVTATTDSNGVATATITFSNSGTLTVTYGNVTDTATITVSSYLFYDECTSSSGLSNYGTIHHLGNTTSGGALSYDSTKNAYKFSPSNVANNGFCDIPIPSLDNQDKYTIEVEFFTDDSSTGGQSGLTLYTTSDTGGNGVFFRDIASINRCGVLKFSNYSENGESGNSQQSSLPVYNNWYKLKLEIDGTSVIAKWCQTDDTLVYSTNYTVPYTASQMRVGLTFLSKTTSKYYYVRNIKAEAL